MRLGRSKDYALAPPRPTIPVLCSCSFVFWASCASSLHFARSISASACMSSAVICSAIGIVATFSAIGFKRPLAAFAIASLSLGLILGLSQAGMLHEQWGAIKEGEGVVLSGRAIDDGTTGINGSKVTVEIWGPYTHRELMVVNYQNDVCVMRGDMLKWRGSVSRVDWVDDPYSWQEGVIASSRASVLESEPPTGIYGMLSELRRKAVESLSGADADHALLQALACGYRDPFRTTEDYDRYQSCGVAHLVAVSGAHLVIVTSLFAVCLKAMRSPRKITIAILIAIMVSYLVLAGMPVSAIRAAIMSSVGIVSLLGKRRPSALNSLGIGIFAIVCANPNASISVSFVLSALSTLGIVVFAPLFSHWLRRISRSEITAVLEPVPLTVAASLPTQLYACSMFKVLPLVSPLCNIMLAPLFPISCAASLLAGIQLATGIPGGNAILQIAIISGHVMNFIIALASNVPYASIPFAIDGITALASSILFCGATWIAWDSFVKARIAFACIMLCISLISGALFVRGDMIVMLDVGQGDSFLVASRGTTLLIDTGNQDRLLLDQLARLHITHLDSVLVTHSDDDHCGSLDAVERSVDVGRVLMAREMLTCEDTACRALVRQAHLTAREVVELGYGDSFTVGSFTMHVIWPHEFIDDGGNADSVCLLAEYDGDGDLKTDFTALFTGDAEAEQVACMLDRDDVGKIDFLKVGHHGSKNGSTLRELEELSPRIAFIGVGEGNRYGHPSEEVISDLDRIGAEVFRSDLDGEVACRLGADGVRIEQIR